MVHSLTLLLLLSMFPCRATMSGCRKSLGRSCSSRKRRSSSSTSSWNWDPPSPPWRCVTKGQCCCRRRRCAVTSLQLLRLIPAHQGPPTSSRQAARLRPGANAGQAGRDPNNLQRAQVWMAGWSDSCSFLNSKNQMQWSICKTLRLL